jgi:hypothetical protein
MSIDNWLWRESTWAFNGFCQITDRRIILGVMLHIIPLPFFYPPKIDVALEITIGSKFNNDLS